MAHVDTLLQLKPKFEDENQWHDFLNFIDSHKARGDAIELLLQWEIHLLKCLDMNSDWHNNNGHYFSTEMRASSSQFQ